LLPAQDRLLAAIALNRWIQDPRHGIPEIPDGRECKKQLCGSADSPSKRMNLWWGLCIGLGAVGLSLVAWIGLRGPARVQARVR